MPAGKMVCYPPLEAARFDRLREIAGDALCVVNAIGENSAVAAMPDAEAFFGRLSPKMLASSTKLRWVQTPTASLEHYLFPELIEHPCQLTNMRGLFSDVIAQQVFGYILCFTRNLHTYVRNQHSRTWAPVGGEDARVTARYGPAQVTPIDRAHRNVADLTLGVFGYGAIGREIARLGRALGMKVRAVDPKPGDPVEGVELRDLSGFDALLASSDFLVIAAPHTPETEGLFDRSVMEKMPESAVLINIGRGAIVVLNDLVALLREGKLAGAALDVYETEPLPPDHPLWAYDNVILTPHVAGYAPCIAERHLFVLTDNLRRFVSGEPLRNVVDKRIWC